jgi:hypothetical protein
MARSVAERKDALPALAEVFREHGFAGASLALISPATGLGKGSLYHRDSVDDLDRHRLVTNTTWNIKINVGRNSSINPD